MASEQTVTVATEFVLIEEPASENCQCGGVILRHRTGNGWGCNECNKRALIMPKDDDAPCEEPDAPHEEPDAPHDKSSAEVRILTEFVAERDKTIADLKSKLAAVSDAPLADAKKLAALQVEYDDVRRVYVRTSIARDKTIGALKAEKSALWTRVADLEKCVFAAASERDKAIKMHNDVDMEGPKLREKIVAFEAEVKTLSETINRQMQRNIELRGKLDDAGERTPPAPPADAREAFEEWALDRGYLVYRLTDGRYAVEACRLAWAAWANMAALASRKPAEAKTLSETIANLKEEVEGLKIAWDQCNGARQESVYRALNLAAEVATLKAKLDDVKERATPPADSREAFEAWAKEYGFGVGEIARNAGRDIRQVLAAWLAALAWERSRKQGGAVDVIMGPDGRPFLSVTEPDALVPLESWDVGEQVQQALAGPQASRKRGKIAVVVDREGWHDVMVGSFCLRRYEQKLMAETCASVINVAHEKETTDGD